MASTRQPKHDYLKQLVGRNISGSSSQSRRPRADSFHKVIKVNSRQASILNGFIVQENRYFNSLVDLLLPRLRNNSAFYLELSEEQITLFSKLAFYCFDIRSLSGKKSSKTSLPDQLEKYRDILFGIHGEKEVGISDRLAVFYEPLCFPTALWPSTRENMAFELLDFCISQAKSLRTTTRKVFNDEEDDSYSVSPEMLQGANIMQKRHLQLSKKDIDVTWDEKNDCTLIKIPYLKTNLIVESINIPEHYKHWNFLIIHQDPQEIILTNANWEIDFRTTFNKYLIKYMECPNPDSRMKSRHVRGR